ncbi:Secretory lipase [Streptomyces sp. YIM 130001]|uniref:alpha/beta hydrolase family protein n=1 Tax=Streptomyces sp. YIM 130001 TaxID=2259644 RepID=UPI000EE218E8|nr:acetylxylan esterase [Streptomyces sp. YIM 130001]RII11177.1 Secretory lipase [Streptomyces sp. YIM 130001]
MMGLRHTSFTAPARRSRRGTLSTLVAVALLATVGGAVAADDQPAPGTDTAPRAESGRGSLVSVTPLERQDPGQVARAVEQFVPGGADTARHGVAAYRLTYRTVTPEGRPTTATGLLTLPSSDTRRLTTVLHSHGTLAHRGDAPSVEGAGLDRAVAALFASGGRAVVAPDYLGLGKGPRRHPYLDTESAVSASMDMLRAARYAASLLHRSLNGDVFSTGFSQGGQVAMAMGRALSEKSSGLWRLRGLAPVSGPYDLEASMRSIDDGPTDATTVAYVTYLLTAQNRLHPLYDAPADVFRSPYADFADELFDSEHKGEEIERKLPKTVPELLTDTWAHRISHPTGAFLKMLRTNDTTCKWSPSVPVRLYTSSGDTDVPIANTHSCRRQLAEHGARAEVTDQGTASHFEAFQRSVPEIARWIAASRGTG